MFVRFQWSWHCKIWSLFGALFSQLFTLGLLSSSVSANFLNLTSPYCLVLLHFSSCSKLRCLRWGSQRSSPYCHTLSLWMARYIPSVTWRTTNKLISGSTSLRKRYFILAWYILDTQNRWSICRSTAEEQLDCFFYFSLVFIQEWPWCSFLERGQEEPLKGASWPTL